jgi:hypothetical protein
MGPLRRVECGLGTDGCVAGAPRGWHVQGVGPYLTLDDLSVRDQARSAPEDLLRRHPRMTLDEVQREPDLLLALEALVDRDRPRQAGP